MPKSRNRSRDARKRAQKKREKREKLARQQHRIFIESKKMLDSAAAQLVKTDESK